MLKFFESLSNNEWSDLLKKYEEAELLDYNSKKDNYKYRYLGEIDDPMEVMCSNFATDSDTDYVGKTNWFIREDGKLIHCSDLQVDMYLFDRNKITNNRFEFENIRDDYYRSLNKDQRIQFRMDTQGISKEVAIELVEDYDYFGG